MIPVRNACLLTALIFVLIATGASATALAQAQRATDRKVSETKQPVAQYDIGHIVKRLAAVEAQAAELKKQNAALANQIADMKLKAALASKNVNEMNMAAVPDRLKRLEDTLRNHTHYLPDGITALSALPGMQDIAKQSGVSHVIEQWKGIKMLVAFGNGGTLGRTGPVVPSQ